MLFDLYELKSRYELEYELGDYDANLNILSKEIFNITSKLYSLYIEKEVVRFHHKANNNRDVYVDFQNVSENTWFRSEAEIKEILYRPKVKGQFQKQFSISSHIQKILVSRRPNIIITHTDIGIYYIIEKPMDNIIFSYSKIL